MIKLKPNKKKLLPQIIKKIKKKENIIINPAAEKFIINICNNSIRLIINYLEKFSFLNKKINLDIAKKICTNISYYDFEKYTNEWYKNKDLCKSVKIIYNIFEKGYSVMDILDCYFKFIKINTNLTENIKYQIIKHICKYISLFHTLHEDEIELLFFTQDLIQLIKNN